MKAKLKYRCDSCGELHDDDDEAEFCCRPNVSETWVCGLCDSENHSEEEAEACCPLADPLSTEAMRLSVEELEQAGQKRLIP